MDLEQNKLCSHLKKYIENNPQRYEDIILRTLNSIGYSMRTFLYEYFVAVSCEKYMDADEYDYTSTKVSAILDVPFQELIDKKYIKLMIEESEHNKSITQFYMLTFKGAYRVFSSIKNRRKVSYMKKLFEVIKESGWYYHVGEDVRQYVRSRNKLYGPFFNYDDPANPQSQEYLMEILG